MTIVALVINERQVYEGGRIERAKARLIFGATNRIPPPKAMQDLQAFYERFIIRVESAYVGRDFSTTVVPDTRRRLLAAGWENEVTELRGGYHAERSTMPPVACLNDILLLNRAMTEFWGGPSLEGHDEFLNHYHRLVLLLVNDEAGLCEIDDRKFIKLLAVFRAHSLLRTGQPGPPKLSDLVVLKHVWNSPELKLELSKKVDDYIAGAQGKK